MSITEYMNTITVHDKWKALVEYIYDDKRFQVDLIEGEPETKLEKLLASMGQRLSIENLESKIRFTLEVD